MSENQIVYPTIIDPETGIGRVEMTHETSGGQFPYDVVLSPTVASTWNDATDDQRRASMAVVALGIANIVQMEGVQTYGQLADAYNLIMLVNSDEPDHLLEYVPDRPFLSSQST